MIIRTFGASGRQRECERRLSSFCEGGRYEKLILLPIPTSRDGVLITGTEMDFASVAGEAAPGTLAVGYNIPDGLADMLCERGAEIYDAGLDERFLCENADITARGALGRILCEFKKDVSEMKVALVGYGRIGQRLTRLLLFLGADVTVYTRREDTRMDLAEAGLRTEILSGDNALSGFDLIVNTAPAKIMSDKKAERLCENTKIMDLASGKNFPSIPGVIKLASVPDSMYPVTAGRIYAKYIAEYL